MKLNDMGDKAVRGARGAIVARRAIVILWGLVAAFGALAQPAPPPDPNVLIRAFACRVLVGKGGISLRASVISNSKLAMVSLAERLPGRTQLQIVYNPSLMNRYHPVSRLFWLEHECAHHTLGHTLRTGAVDDAQMGQDEDAADCAAIQTMIRGLPGQAPMIDAAGLKVIAADVARLMPGGGYYKPGAVRARHIEACARALKN